MPRDLYIYYRVRVADAQALRELAGAMQTTLRREYDIDASLKRRPEEKDGRQTWMEVYLRVPEDFDAALERAVEQAGLAPLIDGPRHIEYFLDVTSCA